jgi:hypothetical protein
MNLHQYTVLPLLTIALTALNPFVTNASVLNIERDRTDFNKIASKKKPPVRVKKPAQSQVNCTLVRGEEWSSVNDTISVGLKAFTAFSSLHLPGYTPSHLYTCKIIVNSGNIRYVYALPDNSGLTNVKINAYLDGKQVTSINLNRGEADTIDLNTSGAKSFAISIDANGLGQFDSGGYVYAIKE